MHAVDTNVLVYAYKNDSPFHVVAKAEVDALASSPTSWAIPWSCIHEFYSIASNRVVFKDSAMRAQAIVQIEAWMASPSLRLLSESTSHWRTLSSLIESTGIAGATIHDARIAAICIDHGVTDLLTLDRDFTQFPGLKVRDLRD